MTPQRPIKIKALSKVWDNYVEEKMAYLKQINFLYVTRNWSCILMVLILVLLSIRLLHVVINCLTNVNCKY